MSSQNLVRIRTSLYRPYKVCAGQTGCTRPVLPAYGLCRTHRNRRLNSGTTFAAHPLNPRSRTPYIQASLVYCKRLIRQAQSTNRRKTPSKDALLFVQTLSELDTFIRDHCQKNIRFNDLNHVRHIPSKRKAEALPHATLTRWPHGTLAALAVFCSILGTRLASQIEGPDLPPAHRSAFRRSMQVKAVLHLIHRRGKRPPFMTVKEFYASRPKLSGRWIAQRIDEYLEPYGSRRPTARRGNGPFLS